MDYITAEEYELLSFFEVEPERASPDIPWPYNDFSYRVSLGAYDIAFGIYPAYKDLSLTIRHNGMELYSFVALSVKDVRYIQDPRIETLEILISDRESIWPRLRPTVLITQKYSAEA
ncbi:hypothetical protein [Stutzerimonas zhaodongensis]|uniref:hypothetical protein n=1 Tax=Stutzerimonas zhaodongensis TaxID=1176257 RepID=UPI002104EE19|nr:hypothetical protein [Stutzerimonas zhaodongensis]MCQ2032273.1 hypothetical protein [Stutzerimonas zhaodongensis]